MIPLLPEPLALKNKETKILSNKSCPRKTAMPKSSIVVRPPKSEEIAVLTNMAVSSLDYTWRPMKEIEGKTNGDAKHKIIFDEDQRKLLAGVSYFIPSDTLLIVGFGYTPFCEREAAVELLVGDLTNEYFGEPWLRQSLWVSPETADWEHAVAKSLGYRAIKVQRDVYKMSDGNNSAYLFSRQSPEYAPYHRLTAYFQNFKLDF